MPRFRFCFALLLLFFCGVCLASGCSPRQKGASPQGFYASGRGAFSIGVTPPLALAATGVLSGRVPADVNIGPTATFTYGVFTDPGEGPVARHVHSIFSELPREKWRWEMETWARTESVSYTKQNAGGKYWTVQIMPVTGDRDWFSALWQANGRQTPDFWLAKRWSARPEDEVRIVVEYREPAPLCMREDLEDADRELRTNRNAPQLHGRDLRRGCEEALEAFSKRADAAVSLDGLAALPESPVQMAAARPDSKPDMGKLVGRAEYLESGDSSYPK